MRKKRLIVAICVLMMVGIGLIIGRLFTANDCASFNRRDIQQLGGI